MEVLEAIKTRRGIRRYKPHGVPEEKLNIVLEAGRWAPSWKNTQCWRFVVVKDREKKSKLAETLTPDNPAISAIKEAPVLIVACAELGKSGFFDGRAATDKGDWYMFDVALAMQNLALAAHSLGLGTVHVGAFDARKAAEILDVPPGVAVVEMAPLGYPAQEVKAPSRKKLSELVFWESYGQGRKP
jgi:nitroreductase